MLSRNEILDKIEQLEKDKMGYLEVNDKAGARRREKQIRDLENQLELLELKDIKEDLKLYKKFIKEKGMQNEFQSFCIVELAKNWGGQTC